MSGTTIGVAALFAAAVAATLLIRRRPRAPRLPGAVVSAVLDALPGGNCGACGNGSCFDAASRIASGQIPASACVTGGEQTADAVIAALRGEQAH